MREHESTCAQSVRPQNTRNDLWNQTRRGGWGGGGKRKRHGSLSRTVGHHSTQDCNKAIYRLESLRCKVGVYFMFRNYTQYALIFYIAWSQGR